MKKKKNIEMETWLRDSSLFSFSLNEKRVFLVCTSFLHQANEQENALAFMKYHLNYVPPPASMTSEMWYEVDVQHPPPSLDLSLLSRLCLEIQNPYELETLLRSSLTFCMPVLCSWVGVRSKRVTDNDRVPDTSSHCEALLMELRRVANKVVWPQTK